MLYFKQFKRLKQQTKYFQKEIFYKIYKLLIILTINYATITGFFHKKCSKFYFRNICIFSYKSKSIRRALRSSRNTIRGLSNFGIFFGYYKAS